MTTRKIEVALFIVPKNVKPVAVLAGNFAEYREYAAQHPNPQPIYCNFRSIFEGMEFSAMVEVGHFWGRDDARDLWDMVKPMVRP